MAKMFSAADINSVILAAASLTHDRDDLPAPSCCAAAAALLLTAAEAVLQGPDLLDWQGGAHVPLRDEAKQAATQYRAEVDAILASAEAPTHH